LLVQTLVGAGEEVKKVIKDWFYGLVTEFYDTGIQKFVT
jgi:hypothetical protein